MGLLGHNGAGKTTTFYMIVGLIRPSEGRIFLDTEEITALPVYSGLGRYRIPCPGSFSIQEYVCGR